MSRLLPTRLMRALCCSGVLLALLLLLESPTASSAFIVRVPSNSEECFIETVQKGDKITGNFRVIAGGSLDIDIRITDPSLKIVFEQARRSEDTFTFYAGMAGQYHVCFSNSMSLVTGKVVAFNIYAGSRLHERDAASSEHVSPLATAVQTLTQGITQIKDTNRYMKSRERVHHQTVESTNSRVVLWRLVQMSALLAMAAFKIIYVRNMFEKKRGA